MTRRKSNQISLVMERLATAVARWTGSTSAFSLALAVILVWAFTGPLFRFSDTWQLVINTGTTIVTFLMVFLIQRSQNKDSLAIHLKLNELVAAVEGASNRLIEVESLTEDELNILRRHYSKLAQMAKQDTKLTMSHSVEEAEERHKRKDRQRRPVLTCTPTAFNPGADPRRHPRSTCACGRISRSARGVPRLHGDGSDPDRAPGGDPGSATWTLVSIEGLHRFYRGRTEQRRGELDDPRRSGRRRSPTTWRTLPRRSKKCRTTRGHESYMPDFRRGSRWRSGPVCLAASRRAASSLSAGTCRPS